MYAQVQGVADLLRPWFAGPPEPLTNTLPPQSLGDPDSRWVCVDGINLHYKEVRPARAGWFEVHSWRASLLYLDGTEVLYEETHIFGALPMLQVALPSKNRSFRTWCRYVKAIC